MTPTEMAAVERHKRFHAHIAALASERLVVASKSKVAQHPQINESEWWNCMWMYDLVYPQVHRPVIKNHIAIIIDFVCGAYKVSKPELISRRRDADISLARQVGMHLSRKMTLGSYAEIGRRFGRLDHTTAMYANKRIKMLLNRDLEFASQVHAIEKNIRKVLG